MSNSTDQYWSVNGESLQTLAFNVTTLGGKFQTPPLRGEDRQFAYKHGAAHRPRTFDSQSLVLGMWVVGADESGQVPEDREYLFRANMKKLQRLFVPQNGAEFEITKRWREEAGGPVIAATGRGKVPSGLQPAMEGGPFRAVLVADILMADPFFYGDPVSVTVPLGGPVVIENPGDVGCTEIEVKFVGQLTNPLLTNTTPAPDVWLKLGSAIAVGDAVTASVEEATVRRQNDGANLIGAVQHSGSRAWFGLAQGSNSVTLTADGGAGHAVITYRPTYY